MYMGFRYQISDYFVTMLEVLMIHLAKLFDPRVLSNFGVGLLMRRIMVMRDSVLASQFPDLIDEIKRIKNDESYFTTVLSAGEFINSSIFQNPIDAGPALMSVWETVKTEIPRLAQLSINDLSLLHSPQQMQEFAAELKIELDALWKALRDPSADGKIAYVVRAVDQLVIGGAFSKIFPDLEGNRILSISNSH